MVFMRIRSDKIPKKRRNVRLSAVLKSQISAHVYVFRYEKSKFEVHFETRSRSNGVYAHASNKIMKNAEKCP